MFPTRQVYPTTPPSDCLVPNVKSCPFCEAPVDRFEHLFQCRGCHAIGDLVTGMLVPPKEPQHDSDGD